VGHPAFHLSLNLQVFAMLESQVFELIPLPLWVLVVTPPSQDQHMRWPMQTYNCTAKLCMNHLSQVSFHEGDPTLLDCSISFSAI